MNIHKWLKEATEKLESVSVPSAKLDAEVLLADLLDKDRSWLHTHPDFELKASDQIILDKQISRRTEHEPIAYIRGKQEFYGREFIVSPDTLTPRPETETMVEVLLEIVERDQTIIDLGTGSGCIAITAKLELPDSAVYATEISESALKIAKQNAAKLKSDVTFLHADLMSRLDANVIEGAILCCNLPYVPDDYTINKAATHEPKIALFSGNDGLDHYRKLFSSLAMLELRGQSPAAILTETLPMQHKELELIANEHDYKLMQTRDFIQVFIRN